MPDVARPHALTALEQPIELFEDPLRRRDAARLAFDSDFVAARVDADRQGPLDESQGLFAVSVEGDGRRVVVESQALRGLCIFE